VYHPQTNKIEVTRDVQFKENQQWDWNEGGENFTAPLSSEQPLMEDENIDDFPVRGTRMLSDIYQRCNLTLLEPGSFHEAKKDSHWMTAMEEELNMIEKNNTWELVDRPNDRKIIGVRWVFRTKLNLDGSINKHKARLVVKGYAQVAGMDYFETYTPVARLDTIRLVFSIVVQQGWKIFQLDVKSAFLNGYLKEEIFIEQPEGFVVEGHENKVYLLKKALYGLKQAPRAWNARIDEHLLSLGFNRSLSEPTLSTKHSATDSLIVSLYVDDLLVTGSKLKEIDQFKLEMMRVFEMTDLGEMSYFLGMEIQQFQHGIFIHQLKYAKEILKKFQMEKCKPMSTPMEHKAKLCKEDGTERADEAVYRSLVGCLMYLTATRPDILQAVSMLSRFLHCATSEHHKVAKRVLRYIKGTLDYGVLFYKTEECRLYCFSDSDWGGSLDDMKSTSGYCFTIGSGVFSWSSKKQEIVAQSTAKAEFIAATAAVNQALWLKKLLIDLNLEQEGSIMVFVDNQAAIAISNNPVFHNKTKHFNIKLFFLREVQQKGEVKLLYCKTED